MNFSVSSPRPTEKKTYVFLCIYFFFLCGLTHRKISFNLGENNFSVHVRPTEKLFLTVNPQKNLIFMSLYFCGCEGTLSEKYFSDGIRIFLCFRTHKKKRDSSSDFNTRGLIEVDTRVAK
jgi:hypothetical protein